MVAISKLPPVLSQHHRPTPSRVTIGSGSNRWPPRDPTQDLFEIEELRSEARQFRGLLRATQREVRRLEAAAASVHFQGRDFSVSRTTTIDHLRARMKHHARQRSSGGEISPRVSRHIERVLANLTRLRQKLARERADLARARLEVNNIARRMQRLMDETVSK